MLFLEFSIQITLHNENKKKNEKSNIKSEHPPNHDK